MMLLHEVARFNMKDRYFITGMNPDSQGGGVIGTAPTLIMADILRDAALKQNYSMVRVRTWAELNNSQ